MEQVINYPIKYAILPKREENGFVTGTNELMSNYEVTGYVVSKCYLVSETKKYLEDGTSNVTYEVVFPYSVNTLVETSKREIPSFNFNGECTNSVEVSEVFNNYDDAKEVAMKQNQKIYNSELGNVSFIDVNYQENIRIMELEYNKKLGFYKKIEDLIELNTSDMIVDNDNKKQR